MSTWGPTEWTAFFAAAGIFVAGFSAAIVAVVKAFQAGAKADANSAAIENLSRTTDVRFTNTNNTQAATQQTASAAQTTAATAMLHATPPAAPSDTKGPTPP